MFLATFIFVASHLKIHPVVLKGKNCVLFIPYKNGWLAASDLFDMFTQLIKFYYTLYYHVLTVQMFKKCDSSNRQ